jgi:hypothetical protein
MLIKFKKPDPRAGMTVRMDSSRGQQLVDDGAADKVSEADGTVLDAQQEPASAAVAEPEASKPAAKKATRGTK